MFRLNHSVRFLQLPAIALALAFAAVAAIPAGAGPYKVLHSFCSGGSCGDGSQPKAALTMDLSGNLFGTAAVGGHSGHGTVFELTRSETGKLKFDRIYSFCPRGNCSDGANPFGSLIVDTQGNLFGTAAAGGNVNQGAVFKLSPGGRKGWTETVIYNFCQQSGCSDGAAPAAGLTYAGAASGALYDGTSSLYGTTTRGGSNNLGSVFSLTPNGDVWEEGVIYSFCMLGGEACTDGKSPQSALLLDSSGNLFGTTVTGGGHNVGGDSEGAGVLYQLAPNGDGTWTQTVLHHFCSSNHCADGARPFDTPIMDATGALFGTTSGGGKNCAEGQGYGCGTIFKLIPQGDNSPETILYAFCSKKNCKDGFAPGGGVTMDSSGNLFGTTRVGGNTVEGGGVLYELGVDSYNVLHRFCSLANCADGNLPDASLVLDSAGTLYGTTVYGGTGQGVDSGTVFEFLR
jgi:uncharacterized repeat protein (TIGR03803 family)